MNALNDTVADEAIDVPALLRGARVQRGEDIAEVASILRIRRAYLEAIEAGDFNSLPGNAYTLGFIRSYSEHLGLDGEEILRRFKAQPQGVEAKSELTFPTFVPQHGIPGMAVILVGLIIAGGGYGVWYFMTQGDRFGTELVQPVPASVAALPTQGEAQIDSATRGDVPAKPDDAAAQPSPQISPPPVTPEPSQPTVAAEAVESAATAATGQPMSAVEATAPTATAAINVNNSTSAISAPEPARQEPTAAIVPPAQDREPPSGSATVSTVAAPPPAPTVPP
ncbi:MAG: helix-turn-helix transcriptional regulator, partial [Proteobacteria bacterium]|nr:helix-turn-helix transcriptional regulator [Pseudomonadota bacterium]